MGTAELAARLPDIETLRGWSLSLAVLDAIMSPDWELRYYSFDRRWGPGEEMASMRNGSGDEYSIVLSSAGAYIRGFDHESPLSPWAQSPPRLVPGLVDAVPAPLRANVEEPAFTSSGLPQITVCLWREASDVEWQFGVPTVEALSGEDGGADWLFADLDGSPDSYVAFAAEYYEVGIRRADVQAVFENRPLNEALVARLNPEADPGSVLTEVRSMGYPTD